MRNIVFKLIIVLFPVIILAGEFDFHEDQNEFSDMLIITPSEFTAYLGDFIKWKTMRGIRCYIAEAESISAQITDEDILAFISNAYYNWSSPPDYVLLVGDIARIPTHYFYAEDPLTIFSTVSHETTANSDTYYGCISGDDHFVDVYVGRIPAGNLTQLLTVINKIISYEFTPPMENPDYYTSALVCSEPPDYYPSMRRTKLQTREIMLNNGYNHVDTVFSYGLEGQIVDMINEGRTIINYRGVGCATGWVGVDFYNRNIEELNNGYFLPVVFGIGCQGATLAPWESLGVKWIVSGTPNIPKGAVLFIGPTENTHTAYNNQLDISIFRAIFRDSIYTAGKVLAAGKMGMWNYFEDYFSKDPRIEDLLNELLWKYQIIGDPSLSIRTTIPKKLVLHVPDSVFLGESALSVSVCDTSGNPLSDILCTIISGNGNSWIGKTTPSGSTVINIINSNFPDTLLFTAFGHNTVPDTALLPVSRTHSPFLAIESIDLCDTSGNGDGNANPGENLGLNISLSNLGETPAYDVKGSLRLLNEVAEIIVDSAYWGTIDSMETLPSESPFQISLSGNINQPEIQFKIVLTDSGGQTWDYEFPISIHKPLFIVSDILYFQGDTGLAIEDTIRFGVKVKNLSNTDSDSLMGYISTPDPDVIILEDTVFINPVAAHDIAIFRDFSAFVPTTFYGKSSAPFKFCITPIHVNYNMLDTFRLIIPSVPSRHEPTPDNTDYYFCFDKFDYGYQEYPEYYWVEISPKMGGNGEPVPYLYDLVDFPFPITFYESQVSHIIISHRGWVTFGTVDYFTEQNYPLPTTLDGVNGIIAPFWRHLGLPVSQDYDVSYFYDDENHRFIVEWYNVPRPDNSDFRETFEIVIHDPEYYPSISNSPVIDFIYKDISTYSLLHQDFTVGIEDIRNNNAINYIFDSTKVVTGGFIQDETILRFARTVSLITSTGKDMYNYQHPQEFQVGYPVPNPFNCDFSISFFTLQRKDIEITIYNLLGECVFRELKRYSPGLHSWTWDARSRKGQNISSGIYFITLSDGDRIITRKITALK